MSQPGPAEGQTVGETEAATVTVAREAVSEPTLHLRLVRPNNPRRVGWQAGTIDNEHMNKKKSKCCCVYRKPKPFGESSSDEEDECKSCIGHRQHKKPGGGSDPGPAPGASQSQGAG